MLSVLIRPIRSIRVPSKSLYLYPTFVNRYWLDRNFLMTNDIWKMLFPPNLGTIDSPLLKGRFGCLFLWIFELSVSGLGAEAFVVTVLPHRIEV